MSKFEKYKKSEERIYPHKHCLKCEKMITEDEKYCEGCLKILEQQKMEKEMRGSIFHRIKNKVKRTKKENIDVTNPK